MINSEMLQKEHDRIKKIAFQQGMRDGQAKIPDINQTSETSAEQAIRSQYQQLVVLLQPEIANLSKIKAEHEIASNELNQIVTNPSIIARKTADKNTLLSRKVQDLDTDHDLFIASQENHHAYVSTKQEAASARFDLDNLKNALNRSSDKPNRWELWRIGSYDIGCYLIILVLCVAEFPINMKVFELFGENKLMTILMSAVLLFIPVAAHFAGLNLRRSDEKKGKTWFITVLVAFFFIFLAFTRYQYLVAEGLSPNIYVTIPLFVLLNFLIYLVAGWISFYTNDESKAFEDAYNRLKKAEKAFNLAALQFEKIKAHSTDINNQAKIAVRNTIRQEISELQSLDSRLQSKITQLQAEFNAKRTELQMLQDSIQAKYEQSVTEYRATNKQHRKNPAPTAWNVAANLNLLQFTILPTL